MEEAGPEGLSQQELGQKLGHGKLEARTICRNLTRRGLVVTIMKDIGRQRVTNFVAKKYETVSHGAVQYQVKLHEELDSGQAREFGIITLIV